MNRVLPGVRSSLSSNHRAITRELLRTGYYEKSRILLQPRNNTRTSSTLVHPPASYDALSLSAKVRIVAPRAALAAGWVYLFREYLLDITQCEGPSMYPTLQPAGEIILLQKIGCRAVEGGVKANDRVRWAQKQQQQQHQNEVWYKPKISVTHWDRHLTWWNAIQHLLSPLSVGDVVATWHPHRPGMICKRILGLPGDQVILSPDQAEKFGKRLLVIPDGHLWLEGDNPLNSSDSRDYGPVPAELVIGRVLLRLWPIRGRAWFRRGEPPSHAQSYGTESTVLPAGYEGQTIVRDVPPSSSGCF